MNEFLTYEFAVRQKIEGKWIVARVCMILLYVSFVLAWLLIGFKTGILTPLLALIPVTTWILVFITWRYVSVEYEYSITSGELTFSKIFGNRSRRTCLRIMLRDAVRIAPLGDAREADFATKYHPEREFSAISSLSAPDVYFILFEYATKEGGKQQKRRAIFYFEATQKALQICRFYNPSSTVITKTTK